MGRDDAKPVSGLQGGTAPARAFSAYMRYAVKDRPVEEFDLGADRPDWQLEPDEEPTFGDPDEYYFIDEDGNLIEQRQRDPGAAQNLPDSPRGNDAPPAVTEDFLNEAIGGSPPRPRPSDRPPQAPRRDPAAPIPPREQPQDESSNNRIQ
jgi:penicillin-binding protein 1A